MSVFVSLFHRINVFIINKIASSSLLPVKVRIYVYRSQGVKIGKNVMMGSNSFMVSNKVEIKDGAFINNHVTFQNGNSNSKVVIGRNVSIAPNVLFETVTHKIEGKDKRAGELVYASIIVEDGTWIGCNATILPGVKIGKGCVIGAGAVVVKDTDSNGVYVGVPARRIRDID